jgi:DNA anti-recombination protein RmuC
MGDDLKTIVENLAKAVQTLQATVEANAKTIEALTTESSSSTSHHQQPDEHHNDHPSRFQKMDFPLRWQV